jgi:hypothetical protein
MEQTRFSLIVGGPFHTLLGRLRLLAADGLPRIAAALVLVAIAWGLPALLIVLQSLVDPPYQDGGFLVDPRAHTRWVIAMAVMILYEPVADRRTSSKLAEALILILAYILTQDTVEIRWMTPGSEWASASGDGHVTLSWAGLAVSYVSDPLFACWLWRFVALAVMLWDVSRLPLRLVAAHPDGIGGLGFLNRFPTAFVGLVFALRSVIAAGFYLHTQTGEYAPAAIGLAIGGWVALMLAVFLGPLMVFVGPLSRFKARMQREYAGLAVRHHADFHRTWIEDRGTSSPVGAADMSTAADLNATVERIYAMRIVPIDRYAVAPVAIAALLPMLPVIATNASLFNLLKTLVGFLI